MPEIKKEIEMPDFKTIKEKASNLKGVLQTFFGKVYLEKKESFDSSSSLDDKNIFDLKIFDFSKENEPIYKKINSPEDLKDIKKYILENYKSNVIEKYWELFEKIEDELDDDLSKPLEIIGNNFDKRFKKIESSFKSFTVDDSWDIAKLQKEFSSILQVSLKDLLDSTIDPVSNGIKSTGLNVYEEAIFILNDFLQDLGIYTKKYNVGDEYTDRELEYYLAPKVKDETNTRDKSLKSKIFDAESVVYLFEDDVVVREATVYVWKVVNE